MRYYQRLPLLVHFGLILLASQSSVSSYRAHVQEEPQEANSEGLNAAPSQVRALKQKL